MSHRVKVELFRAALALYAIGAWVGFLVLVFG